MTELLEIINIVLPVFMVIGIGVFLGSLGFISQPTNQSISRLVFYVAAPALLFRSAALTPFRKAVNPDTLFLIVGVTVVLAIGVYLCSWRMPPRRRGVLCQGAHRSNMVFVGFPLVANAFGEEKIGLAALMVGVMVIVYNLLAVLALSLPHQNKNAGLGALIKKTAMNPLIIACAGGIFCSAFRIDLFVALDRSLDMVGRIAMPLALISIGVSLNFKRFQSNLGVAWIAAFFKLIVYPGLIYLGLYLMGLRHEDLFIPVLIMATPTAVVSCIMVKEMDGDEQMAAAIVIGTTVCSLITVSGWLVFFRLVS